MHIFASCQCTDYACVSDIYIYMRYAGAGEAHVARVTFAVGSRRSCFVPVVSKPRWPRHAITPLLH